MELISREAAIDRLNAIPPGNWSKARYTRELFNVPSVPAVPLDKFYELCKETKARVPCAICEKIMPEWCRLHNKPTLTGRDWWDCPAWEQILTKWMEEQDAQTEQTGK